MKKGLKLSNDSRAITNKYSSNLGQPWICPFCKTDKYNIPVPSKEAVEDVRDWNIENKL